MAIIDTVGLWACVACYSFAHGVLDGDSHPDALVRCTEALARIKRDNSPMGAWIAPEGEHEDYCERTDDDDECGCMDGGFSWAPCEVCLSTLGGDRHRVTLMLSDTRTPDDDDDTPAMTLHMACTLMLAEYIENVSVEPGDEPWTLANVAAHVRNVVALPEAPRVPGGYPMDDNGTPLARACRMILEATDAQIEEVTL